MVPYSRGAVLALAFALAGCATTYQVTPVPVAGQKVRYTQGIATVFSLKNDSAIQVTAKGVGKDGRLGFFVAAFNKGGSPQNFGIENLTAQSERGAIRVYSHDELVREARNEAAWAEFFTVLGGAASMYAANQNAYRTTTGSVSGPGGTTTFYARTYDPSAAYAGSAAAGTATAYGIYRIENALDDTLARLDGQVLQTTTVDPGRSFGGIAVTDDADGDYPKKVQLAVQWGADRHEFQFVITKNDQAPPPIPPSALTTDDTSNQGSSVPGADAARASGWTPGDTPMKSFGIRGDTVTASSIASVYMPGDPHGVAVGPVSHGSMAELAGIRPGDIIVGFDGKRVDGTESLNGFLAKTTAGTSVVIQVNRDGKPVTAIAKF